MRCRCGWLQTGCYSTLPRLRCCGAHLLGVNIRSQLDQYASATRQWCWYLWFQTLGVYIDADLTMSAHITATVRACFAALRQIRNVRRSLTREAPLTLLRLRALVITKVDYCSSTLAGVSSALLQRLQSVLNAAARLVFSARRSEHITPLLRELH